MSLIGKNLDPTKNFYPNQTNAQPWDKPHIFRDGEYIEQSIAAPLFPKVKYHPDYVHDQKPGKEYGFTESAQLVSNEEEEKELGPEWKDIPSIVTCPNAKQVMERKKAIGSNWRAVLELPADINQMHVDFLQSQGMGNINNVLDACTLLSKLGSAAMNNFLKEADEWHKGQQQKRGPGRPPKEAA